MRKKENIMQGSSVSSIERFKKKNKFKDFDGEKSKPKNKKAYRLGKSKRDRLEDGDVFL